MTIATDIPTRPASAPDALADTFVIAGRDLHRWRATPAVRLTNWLFPVLVMVMMGSLFGGAIAGDGANYSDVLLPGMLVVCVFFGLESTATAVATDVGRGVTDRLRTLPVARGAILGGRVVVDLLDATIGLAVVAGAGLALGWRPEASAGDVAVAAAVLLALRLAFLWLGVYLGLLAGRPESLVSVQILIWPVMFCSNVFVDPSTMPRWLGAIAEWNPLSAATTALRERFGDGPPATGFIAEHAVAISLGAGVGLAVVFAVLAVRRFDALAH